MVQITHCGAHIEFAFSVSNFLSKPDSPSDRQKVGEQKRDVDEGHGFYALCLETSLALWPFLFGFPVCQPLVPLGENLK